MGLNIREEAIMWFVFTNHINVYIENSGNKNAIFNNFTLIREFSWLCNNYTK